MAGETKPVATPAVTTTTMPSRTGASPQPKPQPKPKTKAKAKAKAKTRPTVRPKVVSVPTGTTPSPKYVPPPRVQGPPAPPFADRGKYVGMNPGVVRAFADTLSRAAGEADAIRAEIVAALSMSGLASNAQVELVVVDDQLRSMAKILRRRADLGEYFKISPFLQADLELEESAWVDELLRESPFDAADSTDAANALADYLDANQIGVISDEYGLRSIAKNPNAPAAARAAAAWFVANPQAWSSAFSNNGPYRYGANAKSLREYAKTNEHAAVLAGAYDRILAARRGFAERSGTPTIDDLRAAFTDPTVFTPAERAAIQFLMFDHPNLFGPAGGQQRLTNLLMHRQLFTNNPALAVKYLRDASANPSAFVTGLDWTDTAGAKAWLAAARAATSGDRERDGTIVLQMLSLRTATENGPITASSVVHGLLDLVSFLDPTQLADALNAAIYTLEGDFTNASFAMAGMMLPLGGGGAIRITKDVLLNLATKGGGRVGQAALELMIKRGLASSDELAALVVKTEKLYGKDAATALQHKINTLTPPKTATPTPQGPATTIAPRTTTPPLPVPSRIAIVDPAKFDYLFGNVSSNVHNAARSLENAAHMTRLGVRDDEIGRALLRTHLDEVVLSDENVLKTFTNQYGTFEIRESLFAGPSGAFAKFETTWHVRSDGSRRLTTLIPFGG